jgi:hypothetical protein
MTERMRELADEIVRLQAELGREIERKRAALGWRLKAGLVEFEHGIVARHRSLKTPAARTIAGQSLATDLVSPVIYSLLIPLVLIDLWVSLYQAICFRAYRIPCVRRADYITWDRGHLAYLNWAEMMGCLYCAYATGVISYVREVASRTEQYWCPIKHAVRVPDPHQRYQAFVEYGDADGYLARLEAFREQLRHE